MAVEGEGRIPEQHVPGPASARGATAACPATGCGGCGGRAAGRARDRRCHARRRLRRARLRGRSRDARSTNTSVPAVPAFSLIERLNRRSRGARSCRRPADLAVEAWRACRPHMRRRQVMHRRQETAALRVAVGPDLATGARSRRKSSRWPSRRAAGRPSSACGSSRYERQPTTRSSEPRGHDVTRLRGAAEPRRRSPRVERRAELALPTPVRDARSEVSGHQLIRVSVSMLRSRWPYVLVKSKGSSGFFNRTMVRSKLGMHPAVPRDRPEDGDGEWQRKSSAPSAPTSTPWPAGSAPMAATTSPPTSSAASSRARSACRAC